MPDLLLELFSEEIPARMQARAADDLKKLVTDRLVAAGLVYEGARAFVTPRRLALAVQGVPARQPDVKEEKKGPRVGAPAGAISGFLKAAGLSSIDQAKVQPDKKGDFYVAVIEKKGRAAIDVIAEIVPEVVKGFPWPKSMRWGSKILHGLVTESGDQIVTETGDRIVVGEWVHWVRPLHSIVATFGAETEEPEIVSFEIGNIRASNETRGHRFLAPEPFAVKRLDDYAAKLAKAKVVLDPARRKEMILADAQNLAFAQGFELVHDPGLLDEVAGLVEWPVVLMGSFDEAFLAIPDEVIRATIRNNQKCFVLRDPQTLKLVNRFVLVSNIEAQDGGKAIVAGNERVIRARLSDAKFFYETDLKTKLEDRLPKFEHIVFHELDTQAERIRRIERLVAELAPIVGADVAKAERAARLCKADLLTEVVGEFPELQGLMGRYYAEAQGEDEAVAHACEDHYRPKGPDDLVPADPVSIAVSLADKIDMLVGFWAIDEKPTGSKDPYGLRRAALGASRLLLDNKIRLNLLPIFLRKFNENPKTADAAVAAFDLLSFFNDRLKVQLREQGARHDLVDAVISVGHRPQGVDVANDDLVLIVRRVEALGKFLDTEDGRNLLAGFKRATNIIRIEEKKDAREYVGKPDPSLYRQPEEWALAKAIESATEDASIAVANEDFEAAMRAMAALRPHVDAFFEKVTVNVADGADIEKLRENRLKLLNEIRAATRAVADFSRIEG